ncbi:superoxide dismutase family protein [Virgibacillus soli]|uniref:Superoxide dismutase family protein n=1 Tax=Paracerasibacillus soli TaxID=480284 RepID=A0ABU5CQW3_9BACI|nr:superoxide dismutase family protein [Virgibacillus soli]MDY0408769.1 superoxide dismutase family protein [Virgibacillus soli]
MRILRMIVLLLFTLVACQQHTPNVKEIDMYNASGDKVGTAKLSSQPDGVKIKVKVEGLTPGFHGIHIHEYAKCEGPEFKTAGNHLNPEGKQHGLMNPKGSHLGDLPNIKAKDDGKVDTEVTVNGATIQEGKKSLLKGEGTSLIITEGQDDGMSQPAGDSGVRKICGEIKPKKDVDSEKKPTDPTELEDKE